MPLLFTHKRFITLCVIILIITTSDKTEISVKGQINYSQFNELYNNASPKELIDNGNRTLMANETDSALTFYSLIIRKYLSNHSNEWAHAYTRARNNAGYAYFFRYSDYQQAFDNYMYALEAAREYKFSDMFPVIYLNLANIHYVYNQQEEALDLYQKAFHSAIETHNEDVILKSLNNMILYSFHTGSAKSIEKELNIFDSLHLRNDSALMYTRLLENGVRLMTRNEISSALNCLDSALHLAEDRNKVAVISTKAIINERHGKTQQALDDYRKIKPFISLPGNADILTGYLQQMSNLFYALGQVDSAYYYSRQLLQETDSIFGNKGFGKLKDLAAAHSARLADEKFRELEISHKRILIILTAIVVGILLLSVIIILLIKGRNALRRSNEELFHKNESLLVAANDAQIWRKAYEQAAKVKPAEEISTSIPDQSLQDIAARICAVLDESPEVYSYNFSIDSLANIIGSNRQYTSLAINRILGKKFPQLLAEIRIKEACRRLADVENYGNITLEALATECGFRSRTNFISVFKKITGLTPGTYKKIAGEQHSKM